MANTLGAYDPIFYASEALNIIMNMYGMIQRVNHSYDRERKANKLGQYVNIKRPGSFVTQAGGTGTLDDIDSETIQVRLNNWREVKFGVTDQDYAYSGQALIDDHIAPAAYELGKYVNTQLALLAKDIPWFSPWTGTIVASDVTSGMKVLKDAGGSISADVANIHMGLDTTVDAALQGLSEFNAANIAGNTNTALVDGKNPGRFGVGDFFLDQTFDSFTSGTVVSNGTDLLGALSANVAKLATSMPLDSLAAGTETIAKGDTFIVAGSAQRYAVTELATIGTNAVTVSISPPAQIAYTSGDAVTFETKATAYADAYEPNLLFHRDAFALVMGQLPDAAIEGLGVQVATAVDPISGMSVRARKAYLDSSATVAVTLDLLFGGKTLNPNYAVVMRRNTP